MAADKESEAFKMRVRETLIASKFQDHLRTQMRLKMIEKLNAASLRMPSKQKEWSLREKTVLSLFCTFLEKKKLAMTQAILRPELGDDVGLSKDRQILELLERTNPSTALHLSDSSDLGSQDLTLIERMVEFLMTNQEDKDKGNKENANTEPPELTLEQKLALVEDYHLNLNKKNRKNNSQVYEESLIEMRKRYERSLETEVERIRQIEVNAAKVAESTRWREKFERFRDEKEAIYNKRLQELKTREINIIQAYRDKAKELEAGIYKKNQDLIQEEQFAKRDHLFRRKNVEHDKQVNQMKTEHLEEFEKRLNQKARDLDTKEKFFEERLKREMESYKTVTLREIREKKILIERKLEKLNEELDRVEGMRRRMVEMAEKNKNLELELGQKEDELRKNTDKLKSAQREAEELRDTMSQIHFNMKRSEQTIARLENTIHGQTIKIENLEVLKQQLNQILAANKKEMQYLERQKEQEVSRLRKKVQVLEDYIFDNDKNIMKKYLQAHDQRYMSEVDQKVAGTDVDEIFRKIDEQSAALRKKKDMLYEALDDKGERSMRDLEAQLMLDGGGSSGRGSSLRKK